MSKRYYLCILLSALILAVLDSNAQTAQTSTTQTLQQIVNARIQKDIDDSFAAAAKPRPHPKTLPQIFLSECVRQPKPRNRKERLAQACRCQTYADAMYTLAIMARVNSLSAPKTAESRSRPGR